MIIIQSPNPRILFELNVHRCPSKQEKNQANLYSRYLDSHFNSWLNE